MSGAPSQGAGDGPPTLVANARTGYAGVQAGSTVLPFILYEKDGLWAGKPVTLCAEGGRCAGALGPKDFVLDTRGRRPRGELGAELLRKVAAI